MKLGFWLRWSGRDLRARWIQVLAIGVIIAFGTGIFAGLGGQEKWRVDSHDASYELLNMYDVRMELSDGSYVPYAEAVDAISSLDGVDGVEGRLIAPTLVDASANGEVVLVRGELLGVDVANGGPNINSVFVEEDDGRGFTAADSGENVAIAEVKFARSNSLKAGDHIRISGDVTLELVGAGHMAEYFTIVTEDAGFSFGGNYAPIIVPLETVQHMMGREGLVNDLVISTAEGADRSDVIVEIEDQFAEEFPEIGFTLVEREEDPVYKLLYQDAHGDQDFWDFLGYIFLIGAALGVFNLANRIVAAQRRQIGISMALGVPRQWIAVRPLLMGMQIALVGTIIGLFMGLLFSQAFGSLLKEQFPLPVYKISLYMPVFIRATLVSILLPMIATVIPVWRAVRVAPIDAIKTGHLIAKGGGWSRFLNRIPLPGRSFTQMPIRNVLRAPARTVLTMLAISFAIILLVLFAGLGDTIMLTIDASEEATLYRADNRVLVNMDFFYPMESTQERIAALTREDGSPLLDTVETDLLLGGILKHDGVEVETLLEFYDMANALWVPIVEKGTLTSDEPGIILSRKAADDLGLDVGDTVVMEHPQRQGLFAFRLVDTELPIIGIHDNPIRSFAYMDLAHVSITGLEGNTNYLVVTPAPGTDMNTLRQTVFTQTGVTSVQAVTEMAEGYDEVVEIFTSMLAVVRVVVVIMAFLIAFNTTSINVDERIREIATMFAYGLPIRTVARMQVIESFITGLLGTLLGIAVGFVLLDQVLMPRSEEQLPIIGFIVSITPTTFLMTALLGVVTVMVAPLFSLRKMRKMDIPSELRVME